MTSNNIKLMYPLEMYYPDGLNILSLQEQEEIINAMKEYSKKTGKKISENDEHVAVKAAILLSEQLKQYKYFKGVRDILNMLLSGNRTPEELFRTLFPNEQEDIQDFQFQFADACDLILLKDQIDWKKMNIDWYNFAKEEGLIGE